MFNWLRTLFRRDEHAREQVPLRKAGYVRGMPPRPSPPPPPPPWREPPARPVKGLDMDAIDRAWNLLPEESRAATEPAHEIESWRSPKDPVITYITHEVSGDYKCECGASWSFGMTFPKGSAPTMSSIACPGCDRTYTARWEPDGLAVT